MGVLGDDEMPPKALDPVSGRAQEAHLLFMLLRRRLSLLRGQVAGVFRRASLVKNGGIVSAMKRDIGLHKELVGKEAASVPEQNLHYTIGVAALRSEERRVGKECR